MFWGVDSFMHGDICIYICIYIYMYSYHLFIDLLFFRVGRCPYQLEWSMAKVLPFVTTEVPSVTMVEPF